MSKKTNFVDKEREIGIKLATQIIKHLINMGAAELTIPLIFNGCSCEVSAKINLRESIIDQMVIENQEMGFMMRRRNEKIQSKN